MHSLGIYADHGTTTGTHNIKPININVLHLESKQCIQGPNAVYFDLPQWESDVLTDP